MDIPLDTVRELLSAPPADFSVTAPDQRTPALIDALTTVWRASVTGTHTSLTAREIDQIAQYVPNALRNVPVLIAVQGTDGQPIGFAGVNGDKLEMLFLHPDHLGQGLGTRLLNFVCEVYDVREVCVNEQNPKARAFYTHAGFVVYRRSPLDEMGQPFPLLYLKKDTE
ncbi:MAG: GNAT family N-acetyltransferase [Butyricicoccus pullicaecorum]|nr:GNAT family N-acetyltransferase [Butyricicoccus pullicaecorum]